MPFMIVLLLCILLWGVWGLSSKLSNVHNAPAFVTLATHFLYAVFSLPLLWKLKQSQEAINWGFQAIFWIALTAVLGVGAKLLFNTALAKAPASMVVASTATYPLITTLLAVLFLKERVTMSQGFGMGLCVAGVYLVTMGK